MICFKKKILDKKGYYSFLQNFQSIISSHALKLAFNKSMRACDNEQGINKLRPNEQLNSSDTRATR